MIARLHDTARTLLPTVNLTNFGPAAIVSSMNADENGSLGGWEVESFGQQLSYREPTDTVHDHRGIRAHLIV
jgi:hypothetical protein